MDSNATLTRKEDGMDKTTDLLIGIVIGGLSLVAVVWLIIIEYILPRREAEKERVKKLKIP